MTMQNRSSRPREEKQPQSPYQNSGNYQDTDEQGTEKGSPQQSAPGSFRILRGLQQYKRQQEHHSVEPLEREWQNDGLQEDDRFALPPGQPGLTGKEDPKSRPKVQVRISLEEEEAGLHALDQYFARELGLQPDLELHSEEACEGKRETLPTKTPKPLSPPKQTQHSSPVSRNEARPSPVGQRSDRNLARSFEQNLPKTDSGPGYSSVSPSIHPSIPPSTLPSIPAPTEQTAKFAGTPSSEASKYPQDTIHSDGPGQSDFRPVDTPPNKDSDTKLSPYRKFVAELSDNDLEYLLKESNATLQVLLLKNTSRRERSRILGQMPRKKRAELLRSLAEDCRKLDGDSFLKAFHWLHRKVEQKQLSHFSANAETNPPGPKAGLPIEQEDEEYPNVSGTKVLSMILDGLRPEQEEQILQTVMQDDNELAGWLERDRGSVRQRRILRRISGEISDRELALLFGIPRYGRRLRHLLDTQKKLDVLNASIDLARLPQDKRRELAGELFANFPILQEC
ncbi:hypothetical protein P0082_03180 [Candidatus Haliotispira prima]|uniref:Uncharacterized protein n=1 Tax=Candidatus Haliotispira prima TaxID=3034016 RepID=A0ABY8MIN2_9SPIO|nr:hypothetical protein P0082_03180 [Candidatus Haliotispira prima]